MNDADWIFGYGSLIWRPGFSYRASRRAVLHGWRRGFWQASPDHRGVPEAPGRVVTLVEDRRASCWGVAFMPYEAEREAIIKELDYREKNGYERISVAIEFDDGTRAKGLTYVAGPTNPSFIGPAATEEMAAQIATAVGPSGTNIDYLRSLAASLEALEVHDDEVHGLLGALDAPASI